MEELPDEFDEAWRGMPSSAADGGARTSGRVVVDRRR
jgi:hypothetical protein